MSLKKLKKLKKEDLERFTLEGLKKQAKVVYVYDGDTVDVAFYRNEELVRFNCRLEDVDAPELREANGKLVRDFLAWVCMGVDPDEFDDTAEIWSKKTATTRARYKPAFNLCGVWRLQGRQVWQSPCHS